MEHGHHGAATLGTYVNIITVEALYWTNCLGHLDCGKGLGWRSAVTHPMHIQGQCRNPHCLVECHNQLRPTRRLTIITCKTAPPCSYKTTRHKHRPYYRYSKIRGTHSNVYTHMYTHIHWAHNTDKGTYLGLHQTVHRDSGLPMLLPSRLAPPITLCTVLECPYLASYSTRVSSLEQKKRENSK